MSAKAENKLGSLSQDLAWRGLIKDRTCEDLEWLDQPRTFYLGIDASADSLTIGNLAVLMLARRFIDAGWQAVLLAGGATSLVGDPGGKDEERELKSREEITANVEAVSQQIEKLFQGQPHELVNNLDWLADLEHLDFLRDVGKHYSMTELMQRDFVAARMGEGGSGISYAEFSYSLLQGYDFWRLFKDRDVELQIGASDQWANMLSGVALVRKKEAKEVQALSMPLVVDKASGRKFGKSEAGAIWLDSAKTSPTGFYQFWINTDDADVENYLKVFTLLPREKIEAVMAKHQADTSSRKAQKVLADEVTKLVHGDQHTDTAGDVTKYLTGQVSIAEASGEDLEKIRQEIPAVKAKAGTGIIEVLVNSGLASSNSDARRLLESKAIYINGQPAASDSLKAEDFQNGRLLLRRGKAHKDSAIIELG